MIPVIWLQNLHHKNYLEQLAVLPTNDYKTNFTHPHEFVEQQYNQQSHSTYIYFGFDINNKINTFAIR